MLQEKTIEVKPRESLCLQMQNQWSKHWVNDSMSTMIFDCNSMIKFEHIDSSCSLVSSSLLLVNLCAATFVTIDVRRLVDPNNERVPSEANYGRHHCEY